MTGIVCKIGFVTAAHRMRTFRKETIPSQEDNLVSKTTRNNQGDEKTPATSPPSMDEDRRVQISRLTEIGIALSAELDLDALVEKALQYARELTHADAGTLYLLQDGALHYKIIQNESLGIFRGGTTGEKVGFEPVALEKTNVSAYAALLGRTVRIEDVYKSEEFDFSGPRRFDEATGYRARSMLVVPMKNHEKAVIGVVQLINATDPETGQVVGFSDDAVHLAEAMASQAAVAITNAGLVEEIRNLFNSLVKVLATAIDRKSHYTGNHVQRVAEFNVMIAKAIHDKTAGPFADVRFSDGELEEMRLAGWLHDVGKITTPVSVMDKSTKLETVFDRIGLIETRFALVRRLKEIGSLERKARLMQDGAGEEALQRVDDELAREIEVLEGDLRFVVRCNQPGEFLADEDLERLREIAQRTYLEDGAEKPCLTEDEVRNLTIRKGTLTCEEIEVMREHVVTTARMLEQVPFRGRLSDVPRIASQHHEKLNGAGYPRGLKAANISLQSRILAVADLYEALSAKDRPYKKPMTEDQILSILQRAADNDEIDRDIVGLLIEDRLHRRFEEAYRPTDAPRPFADG